MLSSLASVIHVQIWKVVPIRKVLSSPTPTTRFREMKSVTGRIPSSKQSDDNSTLNLLFSANTDEGSARRRV